MKQSCFTNRYSQDPGQAKKEIANQRKVIKPLQKEEKNNSFDKDILIRKYNYKIRGFLFWPISGATSSP